MRGKGHFWAAVIKAMMLLLSTHHGVNACVIARHCATAFVEKLEKGSVESTHKVPTSHYHTKHRTDGRFDTFTRTRSQPMV